VIDPTSPSAQINITPDPGEENPLSQIFSVNNPYESGGSTGLTIAADVTTLVALAVMTGGAGFFLDAGGVGLVGEAVGVDALVTSGTVPVYLAAADTLLATGIAVGLETGVVVGGAATIGYVVGGASPALTVDQGTVNCSGGLFTTATNAPTIIVNGGTLTPENDAIEGTYAGTQPVIEVDGGTLVLGAPDGTGADQLGAFGSAPFVQASGTGMVLVEGGNTFDKFALDFTFQAAGATTTQLTSSAPSDVLGQPVTYTATVSSPGTLVTTGSVEFFDYTTHTYLQTVPVSNGTATLTVTPNAFTAGDTIVATYLPPTNALAPSSGEVTQAVVAATQTTVTGPSATPTYGQMVTFTATVTDINTPSGGTPTGAVEFFDGSTDLGDGTALTGTGNAVTSTFSTATLTAGTHQIKAIYTPTGAFQATRGTLSQTINQRPITVTAAANTKPYDGTTSAAATPTITSGSLANGDTADFTESYTTVNAGTGLTLVPTGTVSDGNGGNNYTVTFVNSASGTITQYAFTYQIGNDSHVYGTTDNFATDLGTTISTGVNNETLGISYSSTGNTTTALVGTYPITGTLSNGTGLLSNYKVTVQNGTLSVTALPGSVFVLDPNASGALTVSGSAALKVPGNLIVDSSSSSALTTSGTAAVTGVAIQVTGGVQKGKSTTISPAPVTGVAAVPDPLGGPAGPNPSGMKNFGAVNLSGTATKTIQPGIYTSIAVSNSAKLTLAPGIYIIEGGGLSVQGAASISGSGVLIVNAGSNYPTIGGTQTYGAITLNNSGGINLSPYYTTGTYANLVIFQTTDNKQAMTFSGTETGAISGTIYAPSAALSVSNGAVLQCGLIVDTLAVSGTAVAKPTAPGVSSLAAAVPAAVPTASSMGALPSDPSNRTLAPERAGTIGLAAVSAAAAVPQGPLGWLAKPPSAAPWAGSGAGDRLPDSGSGMNILIGRGAGGDTLTGGGNNILVSGTTIDDGDTSANIAALDAILAEWASSNSYVPRIGKISAGVGTGDADALNSGTVAQDAKANTLQDSSSQTQNNNRFLGWGSDVVKKKKASEVEMVL
jgi:hypothetical protein